MSFDSANFDKLNPYYGAAQPTHYYKWLTTNGVHHKIEDKRKYLESLGFEVGADTLRPHQMQALRFIESQHFDLEMKPELAARFKSEERNSRNKTKLGIAKLHRKFKDTRN